MTDIMAVLLEKLDGSNEFIRTKGDARENLARIDALYVVLRAMAVGVEVKIDGRYIVMSEGLMYIKGLSQNGSTGDITTHYMGYNDVPYEVLLGIVHRHIADDPKWLEDIKANTAMKMVLNKL